MTQARPSDYWFSTTALWIQLNAAGDKNYIDANCASAAAVLVYMKGIDGLGYDVGHNYRRWTLIASPTAFHDDNPRYVYIAIPKGDEANLMAQVVFPSEEIDIYGKNEAGTQIGPDTHYYIFTQGIISASRVDGVVQERVWTQAINTGSLATDESLASGGEGTWWEWNTTNDTIKFLKTISEAAIDKLTSAWASIKQLVLNGRALNSVASDDTPVTADDAVVTPAYGEKKWVSKVHDDVVAGMITFNNSIIVNGETILKKEVTIGEFEKDIQVGIGSRQGIKMFPDGTIIARSLELSDSLTVPTLKYNSIEVLAGTRWDSAGKGRVKSIISTNDDDHTCQFVLDLNDGEPGEFVAGDILRGFWSNMDSSQNATQSTDDRHGNITRAGFQSIYCRVVSVSDVVERTINDVTLYIAKDNNYTAQEGDRILQAGLVKVQARPSPTDPVTYSAYPSAWSVLSVSGSFDNNHPERQKFFVYTTSYIARFQGVNNWEWEDSNFTGGWGDLTGFSMLVQQDDGTVTRREFKGDSLVAKDVHFYGIIDNFTRFSDKVVIRLSRADGTIAEGETLNAQFVLMDIEGNIIDNGYNFKVTRQTGHDEEDKAWNDAIAEKYPDGVPPSLDFVFADIPESGAVFVIAASRQVSDGTTTQLYTTSASFVLTRAYSQELFMGEWSRTTTYTRTTRTYPTVQWGGCKWYLVVDSDTGTEPRPGCIAWALLYGLEDLSIIFQNASGQRITSAQQYPGNVNLYLEPRLICGNYDITEDIDDSKWSWQRYVGNYGEQYDTRPEYQKQDDESWPTLHPATRIITITNEDMPPLWGNNGKAVTFIVTCQYSDLPIQNIVAM